MSTITVIKYGKENLDVPALPGCAQAITTSDTNTYDTPISLEVMTAGDLKVTPFYGDFSGTATAITIPAAVAVAGYRPMFRVIKVWATGTTATVIGAA